MATPKRKVFCLAFLLVAGLAALGWRLVDLQVLRHDELQAVATRNTVHTIPREPVRGHILDCRGVPLATSQPAKVVCADPTLLGDCRLETAHALAPLLGFDESVLADRLIPRRREEEGKTNVSKFVVLKRKVPLETWDKIQETMAHLHPLPNEAMLPARQRAFYRNLRGSAVFAADDQIRFYPGQRLASHVVGFVGNDEEQTGVQGIELEFNSKLSGIRGWRKTEMDKRQRELVAYREEDVAPRDGLNVVLTIDAELQSITESELAAGLQKHSPMSISCVMLRPRTGEILAMASLPNFDPNHPGLFSLDALRNRVISDIAEPGSTFKIVVVTAGLNEHVVTLNDMFECEHGHFFYAGHTLHDHKSYGLLSVENIITKSSNIGAAKIGIQLGEEKLWSYIHNFGFGQRTGIPLPGEVPGIVHPLHEWTKVSLAQIPMGQGVAVTSLQTALAMCAIANNGVLMRPMLVSRLEDSAGNVAAQYEPQPVHRVASPEAAADMVRALKTVPTRDGTAPQAALEHYTVAGKTGTAQKSENGHYVEKFFSSFVGFFPADHPELCILVVMDEPKDGHYGGDVAAPIFHEIAQRAANYLNLKPDIEVQPPVNQTLTAAAGGVTSAALKKNN